MRRLPLITNSEGTTARRCLREWKFAYDLGYRPIEQPEALRVGTAVHAALEAVWRRLDVPPVDAVDEFERERLKAMVDGYQVRWTSDFQYEVLGVELQFVAPLVNPETGAPSTAYELGGKLDAIVRDPFGDVWIVEHKTSSQDITPGSPYWAKLRLDSQVSTYMVGARALGYEPRGVLYDVLRKPGERPLKATANPKFKKDGTLYANQRATDETPAEYGARIREAIALEPDAYYQRGTIVRLVDEEREAAADTWHLAAMIRTARRTGVAPRNPDACSRFGRMCAYWPVCSGETTVDNPLRYRRVEHVHQELATEEAAQ